MLTPPGAPTLDVPLALIEQSCGGLSRPVVRQPEEDDAGAASGMGEGGAGHRGLNPAGEARESDDSSRASDAAGAHRAGQGGHEKEASAAAETRAASHEKPAPTAAQETVLADRDRRGVPAEAPAPPEDDPCRVPPADAAEDDARICLEDSPRNTEIGAASAGEACHPLASAGQSVADPVLVPGNPGSGIEASSSECYATPPPTSMPGTSPAENGTGGERHEAFEAPTPARSIQGAGDEGTDSRPPEPDGNTGLNLGDRLKPETPGTPGGSRGESLSEGDDLSYGADDFGSCSSSSSVETAELGEKPDTRSTTSDDATGVSLDPDPGVTTPPDVASSTTTAPRSQRTVSHPSVTTEGPGESSASVGSYGMSATDESGGEAEGCRDLGPSPDSPW